mgnify:CR=1 FL=1
MNERIRELAKQCWDERPEGQLHFDNEKFAKLIVQESADFVYNYPELSLGQGYTLRRKIQQHFGLEE